LRTHTRSDEGHYEECSVGDVYALPCLYGLTERDRQQRLGFTFSQTTVQWPEAAIKSLGLSEAVAEVSAPSTIAHAFPLSWCPIAL
jgi:hypothetical protein